jgi:hypothetical protein
MKGSICWILSLLLLASSCYPAVAAVDLPSGSEDAIFTGSYKVADPNVTITMQDNDTALLEETVGAIFTIDTGVGLLDAQLTINVSALLDIVSLARGDQVSIATTVFSDLILQPGKRTITSFLRLSEAGLAARSTTPLATNPVPGALVLFLPALASLAALYRASSRRS